MTVNFESGLDTIGMATGTLGERLTGGRGRGHFRHKGEDHGRSRRGVGGIGDGALLGGDDGGGGDFLGAGAVDLDLADEHGEFKAGEFVEEGAQDGGLAGEDDPHRRRIDIAVGAGGDPRVDDEEFRALGLGRGTGAGSALRRRLGGGAPAGGGRGGGLVGQQGVLLGLVARAFALDGENGAWAGLDQRFEDELDDLTLVEGGRDAVLLRAFIGVQGEAEARGFGADLDVVFLGELAGLFDEGGEIEVGLGAGGGDLCAGEPLGGGTAAAEFELHGRHGAPGAGEVGLDRGGDRTGRHGHEVLHRHEFGLAFDEFLLGGAGRGEAVVDEPALAQHQKRAEGERGREEGIFTIPVHARLRAFSSG